MNLGAKASEIVLRELVQLEGFRPAAYKDVGGYSIGYGHLIREGEEHLLRASISQDQAKEMLLTDVAKHMSWKDGLKRNISPSQAAALTLFEYNAGGKGPRKIVELLNAGKDREAAQVFSRYTKAKDPKTGAYVELKGLVNRRKAEQKLFQAADQGVDDTATASSSKAAPLEKLAPMIRSTTNASLPVENEQSNDETFKLLVALAKRLGASKGLSDIEFRARIRKEATGL